LNKTQKHFGSVIFALMTNAFHRPDTNKVRDRLHFLELSIKRSCWCKRERNQYYKRNCLVARVAKLRSADRHAATEGILCGPQGSQTYSL